MILTKTEKKYYRIVRFKDGTIGALTLDGLLYMFETQIVADKLTAKYPTEKRRDMGRQVRVWYFNAGKDRECAEERIDNRVTVNPQTTIDLLGYPTEYELSEQEQQEQKNFPPFTDEELVQDSRLAACKLYKSRFPHISLGDALFAYNKAKSSK